MPLEIEIQQILSGYTETCGLQDVSITRISGGFSGAGIFCVDNPNGRFCLRRWPANSLPKARILGLHRLLSLLSDKGVNQVAVPIPSIHGSTLIEVRGMDWQLEPWKPGEANYQDAPSEEKLQAAMHCLASFHRAAVRFEPSAKETEWFSSRREMNSPAVRERLKKIAWWNEQRLHNIEKQMVTEDDEFSAIVRKILDLFRRCSARIAAELELAAELRFDLQPCLRDVWHDHVLFTGEEVTGLVDTSACRMENVATDLARLLGSLVADDRQLWDNALEAYQQQRPLALDERALVTLLDRSAVLLNGMTWLDRKYLQQKQFDDLVVVVLRLRQILGRLEVLAASM